MIRSASPSAASASAKFIRRLTILTTLAAIHFGLLHVMASEQIVAKLFAAGGGAADLAIALAFLTLRLGLYLLGPAMLLYACAAFALDRMGRTHGPVVRGMKTASDDDAHHRRRPERAR